MVKEQRRYEKGSSEPYMLNACSCIVRSTYQCVLAFSPLTTFNDSVEQI